MKNIKSMLTQGFNKLVELNGCNFRWSEKDYVGVPSSKTIKSTGTSFSLLTSKEQFDDHIPTIGDKICVSNNFYHIVKIELDVATMRLFVEN